jgi:hypothetical protein
MLCMRAAGGLLGLVATVASQVACQLAADAVNHHTARLLNPPDVYMSLFKSSLEVFCCGSIRQIPRPELGSQWPA